MAVDLVTGVRGTSTSGPTPRIPSRSAKGSGRRIPVVVVLVLVAVSLMMLDLRGGPTEWLRAGGQAVGGPLQQFADDMWRPVRESPLRRIDPDELNRTIADLRVRNDELTRQRDALASRLERQSRLTTLDRWRKIPDFRVLASSLVAAAPSFVGGSTVTLDSGSRDGVVVDAPVLAEAGLVGRVVAVGPTTSTVRLTDDPASEVGVRFVRSREQALVVGTGNPESLTARLVAPLADVAEGDKVVTIGSPGTRPYPPGLPVGTVTGVDGPVGSADRRIQLAPATRLTSLDLVAILLPEGSAKGAGAS